ncbi:hypothetical protein H6F67_25125 [Microcoleus sp. FACHB-1515]|uniref:hypothetical protein n=1 Tax=Cyanophyceae TaxID=3028117 RepID=UPI0016830F90|nr:hypothetical protein [Microcoleus sp. FACHB-1515]MBD2093131.1 hypothetical protein [Microcoleus sp. FACHB-1515]
MEYFDCSSTNGGSDLPAPKPQVSSVIRLPQDPRLPIKHILLGAPIAVRQTTMRLHQLGYADVHDWAEPLKLRDEICFTPQPEDVMSMLVRYLFIE